MSRLLPEPREGELLYSMLARSFHYLQAPAAGPYMRETVGRRWAIASAGLPCNLEVLAVETAQADHGAYVDRLIDNATLFPFYTAFLPASLRENARAALRSSGAGLYTRLGLAAFRVPGPRHLHFCPDCFDEMQASHGDAWWRREHQIPGIMLCALHGRVLRRSEVVLGDLNRHSFIPATNAVCRHDATRVIDRLSDFEKERLFQVACLAVALLVDPPEACEFYETNASYRARLGDVGLMRSAHKVDQPALVAAFRDRWGHVDQRIPGLGLSEDVERSWLAAMVRKGRRAAHPLQHLLLRELLNGLSIVPAVQPFGTGPWVCRNPMADHYGQSVIESPRLRRGGDVVYGDFACECGYLYTRRCSANGEIGEPRYRRFGPLLVPALKASLSRGDSLRSTAASLGIDPKTLMREAATAGIELPWNTAPSGKVPLPRSESTERKRKSAGRRRLKCDWRGIDTDLSAAARQAASEVLAQNPPVRVTRASLERRVVSKDWVQKRSGKLPKAVRAINELAETTDGFRSRRMAWHAKQAFAAGDLRPCEIQRKAGLPTAWLPRIKTMIENARLDGRSLT